MKTYFGLTKKEIKRKYKTKKFLNEIEGFIALLSIVIILFTSVTIYKEAINLIRDYKESEKIIEEHFNKSDAGAVSASMEVSLDGIGDTFSPQGGNSLPPSVEEIGEFTAYNSTVEQCGKTDGITSSGVVARENHTLACPREFEYGTKIEIIGLGIYECEDIGGAIKGNKFDIYFGGEGNLEDDYDFGRQELLYRVL